MRWIVWGTFGLGQGRKGPIGLRPRLKGGGSPGLRRVHATWVGRGDGMAGRVGEGRSTNDSSDGGEDLLTVTTTV